MMMPSRGLHIVRGKAPQLLSQQCRNLSSTPRPRRCNIPPRSNTILRTWRPQSISGPTAVSSIAAIRHASWFSWGKKEMDTAPPSAAQPAATPPTSTPQPAPEPVAASSSPAAASTTTLPPSTSAVETSQFPNLDTITLDNINLQDPTVDLANIPEGVGYLHAVGIDNGWGPTAALQYILENIHVYTGLPWWASIVATAVVIRLSAFPLFIKSADGMARQSALASVTKPFQERMMELQKAGDTAGAMQAYRQLSMIKKKAGISSMATIMPMLLQSVIGYCGFKLMSRCASLPVPSFQDGGFLWLQDLTITDGYLLMPILMAGTVHMMVRLGGETGQLDVPGAAVMKNVMLYGMPAITALFLAWQSGAVCVWFAASGLFGIAQGQLLKQPAVRRALGIAPIYKPKPGEAGPGTLEAIAGQRFSSDPAAPAARTSPSQTEASKNQKYMRPTYQSPKINTTRRSR